ncbi:MAG: MmcQ/YjbR family DNA-binding protein [Thermoleophilaceae bacterium]
MTAPDLRTWCLKMPGATEEFPFGPRTSVFKIGAKMFALSALGSTPLTVSVKCDPELAEALRGSYDAIVPGYHLNKRHWITITLGADASDRVVRDLIEDSYDLVRSGLSRGRRQ